MRTPRTSAVVCLLMHIAGCSAVSPYYDAAKSHHTAEGFKNNYIGSVNKTFAELMRWQIDRRELGLPRPAQAATPTKAPGFAVIRANPVKSPTVTWIGHASVLVQAGGLNVLTDPMFSERASPVQFIGPKRAQLPGIALADLPPIDVVLISHNHYDHLDKASVLALAKRSDAVGKPTLFLVPLGLKAWFADVGIQNAVELDWWDTYTVKGVEFNFTPVQHWSSRSFFDRSQTLWGGYAVFAPDFHWYFSGDTGYSKDFADTQSKFAERQKEREGGGFDLALIPVGAYQPRWFMGEQHVNPDEAVKIHRDLQAKRSVGIHWGTFELTDESLDQPPKDLAEASKARQLKDGEFTVMAVGETRVLPARPRGNKP